jgi:hypothetical protein
MPRGSMPALHAARNRADHKNANIFNELNLSEARRDGLHFGRAVRNRNGGLVKDRRR